jgi:insertion element IS1 protein InsB
MVSCPHCNSSNCIKYGRIHNGKQRYLCKDCKRQFVENPKQKIVNEPTRNLVERLLLERISLRGIVRAAEVSRSWLQDYVNKLYAAVLPFIMVSPELKKIFEALKRGTITIECDEMWSFVGNKLEKRWIWLAVLRRDPDSPQKRDAVVGCFIGDRSAEGAKGLLASIPAEIRENAEFYTDFWDAYEKIFPKEQHYSCGKDEGYTNHVERTNGTFRARCSRLVRQSYSFSKKDQNHTGAIWYFIHHYNQNAN